MKRRLPIRDPIAAHQRKAVAMRRIGDSTRCECGEARPEALISSGYPLICFACDRTKRGKMSLDNHHVAGKSNSAITIPIPVNDHRARLSVDQYDWPKQTRENPAGSPLLAAAACIRGFSDTNHYLIERLLLTNPEMLESLDAFLVKERGPEWWIGTPLEKYAKRR